MKTKKIPLELKEIFDDFFNINKEFLQKEKTFTAVTLMITGKKERIMVMTPFRNYKEKQVIKNIIKLIALRKDSPAYIFASDTKLTKINKEDFNKSEVFDAFVQILFTPNGSFQKIFIHDGEGKPIKDDEIDKADSFQEIDSDWNLWNNPIGIEDFNTEDYIKFKKENPNLFKGVNE